MATAEYVTVFAVGDTPVPVTGSGRTVTPGAWGTANANDPVAAQAIGARRLVVVDDPGGDLDAVDDAGNRKIDARAAAAIAATRRAAQASGGTVELGAPRHVPPAVPEGTEPTGEPAGDLGELAPLAALDAAQRAELAGLTDDERTALAELATPPTTRRRRAGGGP